MKKTLLASAVAATLATTSIQAATIAETQTGKVDMYGRINLILQNADGDNSIKDNSSRIGFRASDKINDDLTAFARAEFRFAADERQRAADGVFNDLRNTYVGLQGGFGKVTFGNFDSIYFQATSSVLDIMEKDGFRALNAGDLHARGDSLAYETANLGGMQFGLGAKHYEVGDDEEWNLQAYAKLNIIENLTLALAFDQNNEDSGKALTSADKSEVDPIIAASVTYKMGDLKASALLESSGDWLHLGASAVYTYGPGDVYGLVSMLDNGDDNGMDIAVGANYKFSRAFRTYVEVAVGNDDVSKIQNADKEGENRITLGARYDW